MFDSLINSTGFLTYKSAFNKFIFFQPVIYQIVDENFRSSGNETVVYQVFNQSAPIQSSQTPIMPKMKQVYQLAPAAHSPSSGSTPMALSPIVSSNPITEIFNLQEEANVRYEKIASTWDQSMDDAWASIQYNKGTQSIGQKVSDIFNQNRNNS